MERNARVPGIPLYFKKQAICFCFQHNQQKIALCKENY
jgi:hypothetical protein